MEMLALNSFELTENQRKLTDMAGAIQNSQEESSYRQQ